MKKLVIALFLSAFAFSSGVLAETETLEINNLMFSDVALDEENYYAIVDESSGFVLTDTSGYIISICDKDGFSKTLVQGVTPEQKEQIVKEFEKDKVPQFKGKVILPV